MRPLVCQVHAQSQLPRWPWQASGSEIGTTKLEPETRMVVFSIQSFDLFVTRTKSNLPNLIRPAPCAATLPAWPAAGIFDQTERPASKG